jgi:hypothetical protein
MATMALIVWNIAEQSRSSLGRLLLLAEENQKEICERNNYIYYLIHTKTSQARKIKGN